MAIAPKSMRSEADEPRPMDDADGVLPLISVIVPTYNRARVLPHLLAALGRQIYPANRFELIVVDNSSSDDTEAVVQRWAAVLPFKVGFQRKENRGPAASRNLGARRSRGDILAFIDSDCVPEPQWLRNGARGFRAGVGLVCGPFIYQAEGPDSGVIGTTRDTGIYPTANLFVRRECFEAVGGFDERFGLYPWGGLVAGEDTDFAWRVKRTGLTANFVSTVVVRHLPTHTEMRQWFLKPVTVQIMPRLIRTIPELRSTALWARYFGDFSRVEFYMALAGVATAALLSTVVPLLMCLPWAYRVGRMSLQLAGPSKVVVGVLLMHYWYLATTAVLIFASTRYRRLVL